MKWSKEDKEFLKKNYPEGDREYLEKTLKRNWGAITRKAQYMNVERTSRFWSEEEKENLKELYPFASREEILEKLKNRTWAAIFCQAMQMELKREKINQKNTMSIQIQNIEEHKF